MNIPQTVKKKIDDMTQMEMARKWRFAPSGDPLFSGEVGEYFTKVFKEKGFFTPAMSKALGWER